MTGDYRVFVGAFPAGEIAERIQHLRERLDGRTARITPPHVTLAGTYWRNGSATPCNETAAIELLEVAARSIRPFALTLGGVYTFLPQAAVLYLGVEPGEAVQAVRHSLLDALGQDKHGSRFTPHLTLAMRLGNAASETVLDELRQSEWHSGRWVVPFTHLQFMQRGPGDPAWRCIHRMQLGQSE